MYERPAALSLKLPEDFNSFSVDAEFEVSEYFFFILNYRKIMKPKQTND